MYGLNAQLLWITGPGSLIEAIPLIILVVIDVTLLVAIASYFKRKRKAFPSLASIAGPLGILGLAYSTFSILLSFLFMFEALERGGPSFKEALTEGLKAAMVLILAGMIFAGILLSFSRFVFSEGKNPHGKGFYV